MTDEKNKYGLVTRSDMDGLVCAVLLKQLDLINNITFVHPKDVQDGKVDINENHITTNLPYNENAHLSFDHHISEILRVKGNKPNRINYPEAPSAARVVFDYYGGKTVFPNVTDEMMAAVDKADSANFNLEDVLKPVGWVLLSFIMDARTGLGRFRNFRISNYQLMMDLIDYCVEHSIEDILKLPDVIERSNLYFDLQEQFIDQIRRCSTIFEKVAVLDLRKEEIIYPGNRFMIYALFPECTISIHTLWGVKKQNTVFAVGKSIFDRSSKINIGRLMLEYGGGGHESAGTCQIPNEKAAQVMEELITRIAIGNR
jgi:nanoRNase/pAp phosphatase (c-di-AMP/oligoRNAs hydrolase)